MPRRSNRAPPAEVPEGERRMTRRSLQAAATPEKPAQKSSSRSAAKGKGSQPSPAPTARGRGRGRGKKAKKDEEEETEEAEAPAEDAQDDTESKEDKDSEAGAGDTAEKKPARGRGRGRGKAAAAPKEAKEQKDEEEKSEVPSEGNEENKEESKEEEPVAEAKEETVTPKKGRGRRSAGTSPAKAETPPSSGRSTRTRSPRKLPTETPTRRSGRARKSAGGEEETTPKKNEEEMEAEEATGQKRKRENDDTEAVVEKKQKVEETAQKTEESMEVSESKEEAPMAAEEKNEPKEPAKNKETSSTEAKKQETPSVPDDKVEPASYPSADEPEEAAETKPEAMDTTPTEEPKKPEPVAEKESEPDMNEYVVVSKDEIPPADSVEVAGALPKEPKPVKETEETPDKEPEEHPAPPLEPSAPPASAPHTDEHPAIPEVEPTSQPVSVIQEPVSAPPEPPTESSEPPTENGEDDGEHAINASIEAEPQKDMAAPSNNIDSVAQEPSATIPDPLFQRQYVANPNIDSTLAADLARKFNVVSYNILADCHAPLSKYPWITPDHLSQEYRHKKLLQELQHLDADVVCLQEVGLQYYENTLKPTLGALGYEGSYMKRVDDNIAEGEATFVRTSRFTVLSQKGIALRDLAFKELANSGLANENLDAVKRFVDRPSVLLISQLRCNNTGNAVTIGNIHVSWEQLAKPDLQCIEVADALKELVATATPQGAFLICGDFNSWPGTPVYQLTKEGYLSDQSVSELQGVNNVRMTDGSLSPLINLWWKGFQHTATNMKSAYHHVLGNEPHTTRYPHNGWVKQVDFVWYSGNTLETGGVLQTVQQDQLKDGIPNASYPSDHISLKTDLVFKL